MSGLPCRRGASGPAAAGAGPQRPRWVRAWGRVVSQPARCGEPGAKSGPAVGAAGSVIVTWGTGALDKAPHSGPQPQGTG